MSMLHMVTEEEGFWFKGQLDKGQGHWQMLRCAGMLRLVLPLYLEVELIEDFCRFTLFKVISLLKLDIYDKNNPQINLR